MMMTVALGLPAVGWWGVVWGDNDIAHIDYRMSMLRNGRLSAH